MPVIPDSRFFCKHSLTCLGLALAVPGSALAQELPAPPPKQRASAAAVLNTDRQTLLTLEECLALALENNLELEVERLNPQIALAGIQSAFGAFDPVLELNANFDDSIRPRDAESTRALGLSTTSSQSQQYSASLGGELPTGTQWELSAGGNQDESSVNDFNTQVDANAGLTLTQPLLRGGWRGVNTGNLRIARRDKQAADADLELEVAQLVTDVYNAYYDLIFRRADLESQREALTLAEQLLGDNQERVRLGTMNSLDITQARSDIATRRASLISAEQALHEAGNILKRLIYRNLQERIYEMPRAAQTPPPPTLAEPTLNIGTALEKRADLRREYVRLEQEGIRVQVANNALLPTLDLEGSFRALGQDNNFARSFDNASTAEAREVTVGVVFRVPLGARTERGELEAARARREQQLLNLKALEQNVIVEVDNTATRVLTSRQRYLAAQEASALARETLEAEQTRLGAGTSTTFVVNQLQRDFTAARTAELSALADWRKSLAELSRVEGTALEANGIQIVESEPTPRSKQLVPPRVEEKAAEMESTSRELVPVSAPAKEVRRPFYKR